MEFIGKIFNRNYDDFDGLLIEVCYEKKAHIGFGYEASWLVSPCDGTCEREEKIEGEMADDLAAFLKDGQPRIRRCEPEESDTGVDDDAFEEFRGKEGDWAMQPIAPPPQDTPKTLRSRRRWDEDFDDEE